MWPQGIKGFESYSWVTFLDADFRRRGANGKNILQTIPNEIRTRTKPVQTQQNGEKNIRNFHLLAFESLLEIHFH